MPTNKIRRRHDPPQIDRAVGAGSASRVARQRLVYAALAAELASRVHALSLTTLTLDEDR
jgi:hypothetical protein